VVREAVRALVAKGLVEVRTRTGIQVKHSEHWDYLDPLVLFERVRAGRDQRLLDAVFELRRAIEVEAAVSAALHRTPDDLRALSATLGAMRASLDDPPTYIRLDIEFHNVILAASHNRLFQQALRPMSQVLRVGRFISGRRLGALPESQHGHEEIFAAIEAADLEEARSAMRRHLQQFEGDIRTNLRHGLSADGRDFEPE
jgi:DNA-binding FadR family transcriptional regulator